MRLLILLSIVVTCCYGFRFGDPSLDGQWIAFKKTFHKRYDTHEEESFRRIIWERNTKYINQHHDEMRLNKNAFKLGTNQFADMSFREYFSHLNKRNTIDLREEYSYRKPSLIPRISYPDHVDWRQKGFVNPVHNQGMLSSPSIFSATDALTAQQFNVSGRLVSLSTQNVGDCCKNLSFGPVEVYKCCMSLGGFDSESCYPTRPGPCRFRKGCVAVRCKNYVLVEPRGDENALKIAVATVGPISVMVDAGHQSFQLYRSGIYDEPLCSSTQLDHSVLIVGYGTMGEGVDYWIVKNSWGTAWGMNGYILMSRNRKNQCGIATAASYPIVV